MPVGPDGFTLRVKDCGSVLIDSDATLYTLELAAQSDDDLWTLLEKLSHQRRSEGNERGELDRTIGSVLNS
jgi:hypothetical protein